MNQTLLQITGLNIGVQGLEAYTPLIKGVDLNIEELQIVALVGGSGSGKTTLGLSILKLLPEAMSVIDGKIFFNGKNILEFSNAQMRRLRGKEISMVFQEPLSAFNPVFTVGSQIDEVLRFHTPLNRQKRRGKVWQLLETVGIPDPKRVANQYPHQLSGGMRQRAMIAQAVSAGPKLIIADEPTSNLDVTLQALVIELFRKLRDELKISLLLITHDLGVVSELADNVAILFDGRIVESGRAREIFENPRHPFTSELVNAVMA